MKRDALVVGINQYPFLKDTPTSKAKHLKTPAGDAEAIAQLLETYGEFKVRRLPTTNWDGKLQVDPQKSVTIKDLQKAIAELFQPSDQQIPETALLFFTGHGLRRIQGECSEGYLGASDTNLRRDVWGISLKWLRQLLQKSPVRQQIIWLDCCHSGEFLNFIESDLGEYATKGRDRCFIVASRDFQVAYEAAEGDHGILSGALLQGLDPTRQPEKWVTNYILVDFVKQALKDAPQHSICTNSGSQIILTSEQPITSNICPYKGLAYFDFNEQDPQYFHGRTALIEQLLKKVHQGNFLAVLGASGSGKSSVIRAGLLHKLKTGERLPGSDKWTIYEPFTPGEHPIRSLEGVIGVKAEQVEAIVKAAAAERVVITIDQFEELFTLCQDNYERQQFCKYLMNAVDRLRNKLCLILAMRSDFFSSYVDQEYLELAEKIKQNLVTVAQMSREELREAIIRPAEQVDLEIDRELVNQMIAEIEGSQGDLPLLQYTLIKLWEQRQFQRLTISDYTRLGGVKKALGQQATKVYQSLDKEEQQVAKKIFLELTRLGEKTENTCQQVYQQDLISSQQSQTLVECVVQQLAREKLIVTSDQELENGERVAVVNMAHESLIRHWEQLVSWLQENREMLLRKQEIDDAAKKWRSKGKPNHLYLLHDRKLREAEIFLQQCADTLPLSELAQDFIRKSIIYRRMVIGIASTAISIIVIALSAAFHQAKEARLQNDITFAGKLVERSRLVQDEHANLLPHSILIATEAMKQLHSLNIDSLSANQALRQGLDLLPQPINSTTYKSIQIHDFGFSLDGKNIVIVSNSGLTLLNAADGKEIKSILKTKEFKAAAFSPDRKYVATVDLKNVVQVFEVMSGKEINRMIPDFNTNSVTFSPNGKYLAVNPEKNYLPNEDTKKYIQVWALDKNMEVIPIKKQKISATSIAFSPDSKYLATTNDNFSEKSSLISQIWELNTGQEVARMVEQDKSVDISVQKLAFSPNGKYLATAERKILSTGSLLGEARIWEVNSGRELSRMPHEHVVNSISFSSDGEYLATASRDQTAGIWQTISGEQVALIEHDESVWDAVFSPDDQYMYITGAGNITRVYELASGTEVFRIVDNKKETNDIETTIESVVFSPDSKYLATQSVVHNYKPPQKGSSPKIEGTTIKVWRLINGTEVARMEAGETVSEAFYTEDGRYFITDNNVQAMDGTFLLQVWNTNTNREIIKIRHIGLGTIALSQNGEYLAVQTVDKAIEVWKLSNGHKIKRIPYNRNIRAMSFSLDGEYISVADSQGIRVLDVISGQTSKVVEHKNGVQATLSLGGSYLATWDKNVVKLLEINSGSETVLLKDRNYVQIVFSPNGEFIATASDDGTARVWHVDSRKEIAVLKYKKASLNFIKFSPKNSYLAIAGGWFPAGGGTASKDGDLQIWDLSTGKETAHLKSENGILNFAFSPNEKFVSGVSGEEVARIWNVQNQQEIGRINSTNLESIAFSPNGKYLITAGTVYNLSSSEGIVQKWIWQPEDLIAEACARLSINLTSAEWNQYIGERTYQKTCPNLP